jgi:hypothetical protein
MKRENHKSRGELFSAAFASSLFFETLQQLNAAF